MEHHPIVLTEKQPAKAPFFVFLVVLFLSAIIAFKMVAPYLITLITGGILALVASPFYHGLCRKGLGRKTAAAIITLFTILLIVVPLLGFVILASRQAMAIVTWVSQSGEFSVQDILARVEEWWPIQTFLGNSADLEEQLNALVHTTVSSITSFAVVLSKGIPGGLLQMVLACLALFFFLIDGRRLVNWTVEKIPFDADFRRRIAHSFHDTALSVLLANTAAAGFQAALMTFAYAILGIPAAFVAGGATFVFSWIPLVGSFPVWVAGTVYLYAQSSLWKTIVMLVLGIITSTVDNVVRAVILKGRSQMHPLVSLVAIFGGIRMFGLLGIFLGPIVAAVVIALLQIWPIIGRRFGLEFGADHVLHRPRGG
ncbi:AI-2E family transporter [Oligoflexus tunisiensis]|uniref:AI-2E family transporter n=1 Tax=Oligoflexus tunisiensis TaxID=708132 RepID=UPI00114CC784|nr:AI-2E family transporter [Oligoflexus tunisiensis]